MQTEYFPNFCHRISFTIIFFSKTNSLLMKKCRLSIPELLLKSIVDLQIADNLILVLGRKKKVWNTNFINEKCTTSHKLMATLRIRQIVFCLLLVYSTSSHAQNNLPQVIHLGQAGPEKPAFATVVKNALLLFTV